MEILPNELLFQIYDSLDLSAYFQMRRVSRRMYQLSISSFYWRRTTYEIEQESDPYFVAILENDLNYFRWLQLRKNVPSYPAIRRMIAFERKEMISLCSFYIESTILCLDLLIILLDLADLEVVELILPHLKHVQGMSLIALKDDRNNQLFKEKYQLKLTEDKFHQPEIIYRFLRYQDLQSIEEKSINYPDIFIISILLAQDPLLINKILPYFKAQDYSHALCSIHVTFTKQMLNLLKTKLFSSDLIEIAKQQLLMKNFDNLKTMIDWGWKPDDVFIRHLFRIIWDKKDGYKEYIDFMFFCLSHLTEIAYQHPNFDLEQFKIYLSTLREG